MEGQQALKGLTMAGRAQKEVDEREMAKGNMGRDYSVT